MRIGITGHMNLTPVTMLLVRDWFDRALADLDPADLTGVSCLAEGADAIFAAAVLDAGGRLEALLPAPDYRDTRVCEPHRPVFDALVERAHATRYVAQSSSMQAYEDANQAMRASVDTLWAVWDGAPSPAWKQGGTADAVAAAAAAGVPVVRVWPAGAART